MNGKGSRNRVSNLVEYGKNYSDINWSGKTEVSTSDSAFDTVTKLDFLEGRMVIGAYVSCYGDGRDELIFELEHGCNVRFLSTASLFIDRNLNSLIGHRLVTAEERFVAGDVFYRFAVSGAPEIHAKWVRTLPKTIGDRIAITHEVTEKPTIEIYFRNSAS